MNFKKLLAFETHYGYFKKKSSAKISVHHQKDPDNVDGRNPAPPGM